MQEYIVYQSCGCCINVVEFKNNDSIQAEFERVGLGDNITIVQSNGEEETGICTFYGYTEYTNEKYDEYYDR